MHPADRKSRVVIGTISTETGEQITGVIKLFPALEEAAKEARILERLNKLKPDLPTARVLKYEEARGGKFSEEGYKYVLTETEVPGVMVADEADPLGLEEVRRNSGPLFDQLAIVSSDELLVSEGIGYCGDISSLNVKCTPTGYAIVDWSAVNLGDTVRVSPRYIPPEVLKGERPMEVNADIYGLGSLLARTLLGRNAFRDLFPDEGKKTFLKPEMIKGLVPSEVQPFFDIALAEDPYGRVVSGVESAGENYERLKVLFGN